LTACFVLAACSATPTRPTTLPGGAQIGVASWYGPGFHGKPTTSGEIYDQNDMTAAHPTLPLGSRCRVTNLENGSVCEVRINDRGPFVAGRSIDLSHAAAEAIGVVGPGTARVKIEPIVAAGEPDLAPLRFAVQVGAFTDEGSARSFRGHVATLALTRVSTPSGRDPVYIALAERGEQRYYRVRVGPFSARAQAESEASWLTRAGLTPVIVEDDGQRLP